MAKIECINLVLRSKNVTDLLENEKSIENLFLFYLDQLDQFGFFVF